MLQLTAIEDNLGRFDIIEETLRATNLGKLEEGSWVNFERFVPALPRMLDITHCKQVRASRQIVGGEVKKQSGCTAAQVRPSRR